MRNFTVQVGAACLLILAIAVAVPAVFSQHAQGRIRGTVTTADGKPLEGVSISLRSQDDPYSTTVFTNEQGTFVFPALGGSKYSLWAQAQGFETTRADAIPGKQLATLRLKPLEDFSKQ